MANAAPTPVILGWARSPVAPVGGALAALQPHALGAPVLQAALARAGVTPHAVDAVILGNALGAGGNPARMVALAAGLPVHCTAMTIDSQCCAGLDAIATAVGLLASGQAQVVVAGGVEAWSQAPLRAKPAHAQANTPGAAPQFYTRPAFAPDPAQDPDLLQAAADYAHQHGWTRAQQDAYALASHARALAHPQHDIVPMAGLQHDAYPRHLSPERAARLPLVAGASVGASASVDGGAATFGLSTLAISAKADGAAMVVLATAAACQAHGWTPRAQWVASASVGCAPIQPLLGAATATQALLQRTAVPPDAASYIELHDAFAVQGMAYAQALGIAPARINRQGGGIARGHPIGASGAIALVRALAQLSTAGAPGDLALAAIAGAGGLGAACLVQKI